MLHVVRPYISESIATDTAVIVAKGADTYRAVLIHPLVRRHSTP